LRKFFVKDSSFLPIDSFFFLHLSELFFPPAPKVFSGHGALGSFFGQLSLSLCRFDVDDQIWVDFFLVLQTMPPTLHVHLLGVGVVELAATQFAIKAEKK
jgi:hypothetical protein